MKKTESSHNQICIYDDQLNVKITAWPKRLSTRLGGQKPHQNLSTKRSRVEFMYNWANFKRRTLNYSNVTSQK